MRFSGVKTQNLPDISKVNDPVMRNICQQYNLVISDLEKQLNYQSYSEYGACAADNPASTLTIALTTDTPAAVVGTGITEVVTRSMTFQNDGELKAMNGGKWLVSWSLGFNMASGSNLEVEGGLFLDGTYQATGTTHRKIGTGLDSGSMSGMSILTLNDDSYISVGIVNKTAGDIDAEVGHLCLTALRIE